MKGGRDLAADVVGGDAQEVLSRWLSQRLAHMGKGGCHSSLLVGELMSGERNVLC